MSFILCSIGMAYLQLFHSLVLIKKLHMGTLKIAISVYETL